MPALPAAETGTSKRIASLRAPFFRMRQEPRRLLVAEAVRGQRQQLRVRCAVEIHGPIPLGGDGAEVPAGGIRADNLTRGLKRSCLRRIAFAGRTAAEGEVTAVRRPIHMIGLVGLVLNLHAPSADARRV